MPAYTSEMLLLKVKVIRPFKVSRYKPLVHKMQVLIQPAFDIFFSVGIFNKIQRKKFLALCTVIYVL